MEEIIKFTNKNLDIKGDLIAIYNVILELDNIWFPKLSIRCISSTLLNNLCCLKRLLNFILLS